MIGELTPHPAPGNIGVPHSKEPATWESEMYSRQEQQVHFSETKQTKTSG